MATGLLPWTLVCLLALAGHAQDVRSHRTPAGTVHELVRVPAGFFTMGSDAGKADEMPPHRVYLDEYYIDRFELTNELFVAFLNDRGHHRSPEGEFIDMDDADAGIVWSQARGFALVAPEQAQRPAVEVS